MTEQTKIEWADSTFNPWIGCTRISTACDKCYAADYAARFGKSNLWQGDRQRTAANTWRQPLLWQKAAADFYAKHGRRRRVFCASLADVFDNQVPEQWRVDLWDLIANTPDLDWLLLTKRPQNIARMLPPDWAEGYPNVWLGTTVEDQVQADARIPALLAIPAHIRFLSCEPMLGPVDLTWIAEPDEEADGVIDSLRGLNWVECAGGDYYPTRPGHEGRAMARRWLVGDNGQILANRNINWVIAGGESGPNARPSHPLWVTALRDQCAAAGVPFFFKQWGEWCRVADQRPPVDHLPQDADRMVKVGKRAGGRLLDGVLHDGFPF